MSTWARNSIAAAVAVTALAACAVGPDFHPPAAPPAARYLPKNDLPGYLSAIGQTQHVAFGSEPDAAWWHRFGSPAIDALVAEAAAGNPSLQAAQASLRESQASLRAGQGIFFPQVSGGVDAARQRVSPATLGARGLSGIGGIFNVFTLSTTVSYVLDAFGGERRTVEGLRAQVDVQRYTMQGAYLSLTGNVVNTALARQAYADEIDIVHQLISLQTQQLDLVDARIRGGSEAYADRLSLSSARASDIALLASLALKRDQADHLLHTLLGKTPGETRLPDITFVSLHLPASLPVSLPSDLVRQRPDILVAEAQLHQASAAIGVATAALFPSITLGGDYGAAANTTGALGQDKNRFWSTDASIQSPLFQGGSRWFNRKASIEAYKAALASYHGVVLSAFQQVADVLKALQHDAEALQANDEARRDASEALHLIQANYAAGLANYVDVLTADAQYRQSEIAYVQALVQRYQDTVALYVAVGGGWWREPNGDSASPVAERPVQAERRP